MDENTRKRLMNECDSLEGNINRMMVTTSKKELKDMYIVAIHRLTTIFDERNKYTSD